MRIFFLAALLSSASLGVAHAAPKFIMDETVATTCGNVSIDPAAPTDTYRCETGAFVKGVKTASGDYRLVATAAPVVGTSLSAAYQASATAPAPPSPSAPLRVQNASAFWPPGTTVYRDGCARKLTRERQLDLERPLECPLVTADGMIRAWQFYGPDYAPLVGDVYPDVRGHYAFGGPGSSPSVERTVERSATPVRAERCADGLEHRSTYERVAIGQDGRPVCEAGYEKDYLLEAAAVYGTSRIFDAAAQRIFCGKHGCGGYGRGDYRSGGTYRTDFSMGSPWDTPSCGGCRR
jgi:hypothetical protein